MEKVVATTADSKDAQKQLGQIFGIKKTSYPDLIAELSLCIQDDLCLLESRETKDCLQQVYVHQAIGM